MNLVRIEQITKGQDPAYWARPNGTPLHLIIRKFLHGYYNAQIKDYKATMLYYSDKEEAESALWKYEGSTLLNTFLPDGSQGFTVRLRNTNG